MGKEWGGMEWNGMGGWAGSARGREKYHRDGTGTIGTGQVLLSGKGKGVTPGRHQSRELDEFFLAFHDFAKVAKNSNIFSACAHTA